MRFLLLLAACTRTPEPPPAQTTVVAGTVSVPAKPVGACPGWTEVRACKADGFVYASADASIEKVAANKAREALANNKALALSELPAVVSCQNSVHVLARVPEAKASVAAEPCTTSMTANAPNGCPDWAAKRVYREGDTLFVVAPVDDKIENPSLRQAAMDNRARAEAMMYFNFNPGGRNEGAAPRLEGSEKAECEGKQIARYKFSATP